MTHDKGVCLLTAYGMTECAGASHLTFDGYAKAASSGKLIPNVRFKVRYVCAVICTDKLLSSYLPSNYITVTQIQYILIISIAWEFATN